MHRDNAVTAALAHLARLIRRRRVWILGLWAIVAAVLVPQACTVGKRLRGRRAHGGVLGRPSRRGAGESLPLATSSTGSCSSFAGLPGPDRAEGREALSEIVAAVRAVPGVADTLSYLDSSEAAVPGTRGELSRRRARRELAGARDADGVRCARRRRAPAAQLVGRYPAVELLWTGEIPLNLDVREASYEDVRSAERRALPIALLLLLAAFGSVVAAMLPVAVGVLGVLLTLGVAALVARSWHLSIFVQNIASMIGLGLGIDYALLMVSRFRESLARKHSPGLAVEDCVPRAGQTLLLSAMPVGIGFAALLTLPGDFRSIGFGGMLVTFFTLLLALTLLPALLAALGKGVNAGRILTRSDSITRSGSRWWRRWGVRCRPAPVARPRRGRTADAAARAPGVAPEDGAVRGDWLPSNPESVRAVQTPRGHGPRQRDPDPARAC